MSELALSNASSHHLNWVLWPTSICFMVRGTSKILDSNFNICYVLVSFRLMCRFVVFAIRFDRICELAEKRSQTLSKVLVKAMLTSPTHDANGYSNTFSVQGSPALGLMDQTEPLPQRWSSGLRMLMSSSRLMGPASVLPTRQKP